MEKITANIDRVALTKALILWCVDMYNEDIGTCTITYKIPWETEWNKYMSWSKEVYPLMKNAIGERDKSIFPIELIRDYLTCFVDNNNVGDRIAALNKLTNWASIRADKIIDVYNNVITELNKRIEEANAVYGIIEKCVGPVKCEKVAVIRGKSETEVINRLWSIASGLVYHVDFSESSFKSFLHCKNNVCIGDGYYCHLVDKVNNS